MGSDIAFHNAVELLGDGRGLAFETILLALECTPVLADAVGVLGGVGEIVFLGDLELELTRCSVLLKDGELALGFVSSESSVIRSSQAAMRRRKAWVWISAHSLLMVAAFTS